MYWRPGCIAYSHALARAGYTHVKQSYQPRDVVSRILSLEEDAAHTYPANSETGDTTSFAISETPSGADTLHNRITIFFADGTVETVDSYILSDEGKVAPSDAFAGLTTGVAFKNELLKWNYEHVIEATEFQGRKIDLVVEPKILIKSGLIP